jgi:hypothetical protein
MIELALYHAALVGVISCLISESVIFSPIRDRLGYTLLFCPICLGFWIALPFMYFGMLHYFAVVAFSNLWMLIILKVYESLES